MTKEDVAALLQGVKDEAARIELQCAELGRALALKSCMSDEEAAEFLFTEENIKGGERFFTTDALFYTVEEPLEYIGLCLGRAEELVRDYKRKFSEEKKRQEL